MDIVERLRGNADERLAGWQIVVIMHDAADEIERLRGLVHRAFCEGQITRVQWDDWKNSEVYAALKGDE